MAAPAVQAVLSLWLGGLLFWGPAAAWAQRSEALPQLSAAQLLDVAQAPTRHATLAAQVGVPRLVRLSAPDGVVVLHFADLREQARAMARIVLLIEKADAPRHRVMGVPEVLQWLRARGMRLELITWGNNLSAEELARFFNTARLQGEALTEQERALLSDVLAAGLLREVDGGWAPARADSVSSPDPGQGAVQIPAHTLLTVPRVSQLSACAACGVTPAQHRAILEHELGHGEFAASAWLQHHARWFWFHGLSPVARSQWQRFLTQRGYDSGQLQIVLGEMHAYLAHTHDPALFRAEELELAPAALEALRLRYRDSLLARPMLRTAPGYQLP